MLLDLLLVTVSLVVGSMFARVFSRSRSPRLSEVPGADPTTPVPTTGPMSAAHVPEPPPAPLEIEPLEPALKRELSDEERREREEVAREFDLPGQDAPPFNAADEMSLGLTHWLDATLPT